MKPNYSTQPFTLPPMASWPASHHQFEPEHILALQAAEATNRPLLIRGETGTGKSQMAHAAAAVTGRAFLPVVVSNSTEATDFHWKFDAIARLADAHLSRHSSQPSDASSLHVQHYVQPGPLWWVHDWQGALAQQAQCHHGAVYQPHTPEGWTPKQGFVLLIDEIDKAEPDVPNGLLEALANGAFDVPLLGKTVQQAAGCTPPLIIITTNDERELPPAFLRRCLVLTLALPTEDDTLKKYLVARGEQHSPKLTDEARQAAADMLIQDRKAAQEQRCYKPGLAEYLDLLRALDNLPSDNAMALLHKLKHFYFVKQPLV